MEFGIDKKELTPTLADTQDNVQQHHVEGFCNGPCPGY